MTDPQLVRLVQRQLRTPGSKLFSYVRNGRWQVITAREVNDYLQRRAGGYSAKDFRTWGGTLRAATVLAELGPAKTDAEAKRNVAVAMRLVSSELGNTATICRKSYVHPMVIARYLDDGETIGLSRSRGGAANRGRAHSPEEKRADSLSRPTFSGAAEGSSRRGVTDPVAFAALAAIPTFRACTPIESIAGRTDGRARADSRSALLPEREEYRELRTVDEVCDAIATLAVRGAPAIGIAGAMGMALALDEPSGFATPRDSASQRRTNEFAARVPPR